MQKKLSVELLMLSRKLMATKREAAEPIQVYLSQLPDAPPDRWEWDGEGKKDFSVADVNRAPDDQERAPLFALWRRKRAPQMEGSVWPGFEGNERSKPLHTRIGFESPVGEIDQVSWVNLLLGLGKKVAPDFAMLDIFTPGYHEFGKASDVGGYKYGFFTHTLRHWLPDLYWGNLFGPAYITLFGLETLLSAPAARVEQIADDVVYLQLTDRLEDIIDRPELIASRRAEIKTALKRDAFFDLERGYRWRDMESLAGKVFEVPDFGKLK